jgi:hypothetical protein
MGAIANPPAWTVAAFLGWQVGFDPGDHFLDFTPAWSFLDRWRMRRLWNGQCFRVAGMLELEKGFGSLPCPERDSPDLPHCSVWRFAYFPAADTPFGDIWHEYSSDVWF